MNTDDENYEANNNNGNNIFLRKYEKYVVLI
jgi:hypothetical protein